MERIIKWFVPKEEKFFDMFKMQSENVLNGANELKKFIYEYPTLSTYKKNELAGNIKKIEEKGDNIVHDTLKELDKSFVTPIDKEDIHRLCGLMDDILDLINAVSERLISFNIERVDKFIKGMAEVTAKATEEIDGAILNMKKLKNMNESYIKIHSLENESDQIYHDALSALFRNSKEAVEIIKYKDIYELMEDTADKCEDVVYMIERIVVKHA